MGGKLRCRLGCLLSIEIVERLVETWAEVWVEVGTKVRAVSCLRQHRITWDEIIRNLSLISDPSVSLGHILVLLVHHLNWLNIGYNRLRIV